MTEPEQPPTLPLDSTALQRRVLLTGVLTFAAFVAIGLVLSSVQAPGWLVLPAMVIVYAVLVHPLMRPVRASNRLRRSLAYAAYREGREAGDLDG